MCLQLLLPAVMITPSPPLLLLLYMLLYLRSQIQLLRLQMLHVVL
jgi:hypothetical protein